MKLYVLENEKHEYLHLYGEGKDIEAYFTTYLYNSEFFEDGEDADIFRQFFFKKEIRDTLKIREIAIEIGEYLDI